MLKLSQSLEIGSSEGSTDLTRVILGLTCVNLAQTGSNCRSECDTGPDNGDIDLSNGEIDPNEGPIGLHEAEIYEMNRRFPNLS